MPPPAPSPAAPSGVSVELPSHTGAPFSDKNALDKSLSSSRPMIMTKKMSNHQKAIQRANTVPLEEIMKGKTSDNAGGNPSALEAASPRTQLVSAQAISPVAAQASSPWASAPAPAASSAAAGGSAGKDADPEDASRGVVLGELSWNLGSNMSHRVPASQYFILGVWMSMLLLLYAWSRFLCTCGVPSDCAEHDDIVVVMRDIQFLMYSGFVLAIMTGMHWPDRFQYIFAFGRGGQPPRGVAFLALVFFTALIWGLLDLVPGFSNFSLAHRTAVQGWNILILLLVTVFAGGLAIWHVVHAFRSNSLAGFTAYVCSRLVFVSFYAVYGVLAAGDANVNFHFHHYMFGYLIALLAEFNHPASLVLLAVGTGIYVQGIAAYEADGTLTHKQFRMHFNISGQEDLVSPLVSQEAADFFASRCQATVPDTNFLNLEQ